MSNVTLNAGTGGATLGTDQVAGVDYEVVKLGISAAGAAPVHVSSANPLPVSNTSLPLPTGAATAAKQPALGTAGSASADVLSVQGVASMTPLKVDGSAVTQPINDASGSITVDNAGTFPTQASQAGTWNITNVSGTVSLPTGASTAAKQPALGTAGSASTDVITIQGIASMTKLLVTPDSVALPANQSVNVSQLAGTTADTNSGAKSAGTLRVVIATDQPALTNKLLVTPDSVALPANQSVNVSQINAVTPLMGNGATGTGSPRVTIASDNTAFSVNAIPTPQTSGGYSIFHLVSAATTNATNVKASAGQVFGWYIYNSNAAARKVAFHNSAGTPTAGTGVVMSLVIPPGGAANVFTDTGIAFSTGIAISMVTDLTDAGATAVAASDLVCNIFYK